MNGERQQLVAEIFMACARLSEITGRPVSPDGHLVGSIGEALAAELFDLELSPPSNEGFDAVEKEGRTVEIKTTTRSAVALSARGTRAERLIVLCLSSSGEVEVAYDGSAADAWRIAGPEQKNGQRRLGLARLRAIGGPGT